MWKNKITLEELKKSSEKLYPFLLKNRYLLIVLLAGILLLAIGTPKDPQKNTPSAEGASQTAASEEFSLSAFQEDLQNQLSLIDGAGRVKLMLSLDASEEAVYASNVRQSSSGENNMTYEDTISVVSDGSYGEVPVQIKSTCPTFRGAVVLCDGADNTQVRLAITEAVSALCGIGADKITVLKMQS